jgi:hypothetical protein
VYCDQVVARCPVPAADIMRADLKSAVNGTDGVSDGASMVQYVGHGNFLNWSDDAYFNDVSIPRDSDGLLNGGRLPWMLAHNCLTGGFHTTNLYSIGEDWLRKSNGGAVAVLAPSGLSDGFVGEAATDQIWGDLFGPSKLRTVAVPVLNTLARLCTQGTTEPCQSYIFLGDPTLNLVFPSVAAPSGLTATPANMRVDLAWTASATPGATYDVWRATTLSPPTYTKVGDQIAATSFADTTAVNTNTYYYYVVATDAERFESRWSNFNSDCAVSGPDCVKATPMNPNPPPTLAAPAVVDPETGGRLSVSWVATPATDLKNYTVHVGTTPGVYTASFNAAKLTTYSLSGLTNGTPYYVAVTATNTSNLTSALSPEASGVPTWVRGLKSPDFIGTLRVSKSGADAVLTWGAVAQDIYGKPETAVLYEVFRGTTATFVPAIGNRIGTPSTPAFTDTGAMASATPYYYLVRAVDADGNVGGLGSQLPTGISALTVTRSTTPGNLVLSWPAVTTDFDGAPLVIASYQVYTAAAPFTRAAIRNGAVPVFATVTSPTIEITPPAENQYYSVLAVDARGNLSPF